MINSMTGFGSAELNDGDINISCEIKSVNHKFLDLNLKGYELSPKLDKKVRNTFNKSIKRGSVDIKFKLTNAFTYDYQINIQSLNKFKKKLNENGFHNDISISELKYIPGVLSSKTKSIAKEKMVYDVFKTALDNFLHDKQKEGMKINKIFTAKIKKLQNLHSSIIKLVKISSKTRKEKIKDKILSLVKDIELKRVDEEIAIMAMKYDVAEELERIKFHTDSILQTINKSGPNGKKIDFILQELFRESNTLLVKIDDSEIKSKALNMKVLIEEMREQTQNIE
ncbi:MAG: YicC/YloC family endoribonuclease [Gammaproteobacteria bacterium]